MTDWEEIRRHFRLKRTGIYLAAHHLASHPRPVRRAVKRHRKRLDHNPAAYFHERIRAELKEFSDAAGQYFGVPWENVAQTVNTTMGMALIYGGIRLKSTQRILTSDHDFSGGRQMLEARNRRHGTPIDFVRLFDSSSAIQTPDVLRRLLAAIQPETRLVALTWVHSNTGVKLPVRDIAEELQRLNAARAPEDQLLLSIDGVHGFGVEDATFGDLGCDFFAAGCHKWVFGPRGTAVVYATREAWETIEPLAAPTVDDPIGLRNTPTGVQTYEHHWAVAEAFRFLMDVGKGQIQDRVHYLASRLKQGLAALVHVEIVTPMPATLSSGIVCFDLKGLTSAKVVERMRARGIIASESSTDPLVANRKHVRLTPSMLNSDQEIDDVLDVVSVLRP